MRRQFEIRLGELRDDILKMGRMVDEELKLALKALDTLDAALAHQVMEADAAVNAERFSIEGKCFELIATQQPTARDLRAIVAVINMIVDLERMGDQAKGIAKLVPRLAEHPKQPQPPEMKQMRDLVSAMLTQSMAAYAQNSVDLAALVANQEDEVDSLYRSVFAQTMEGMAKTRKQKKVEAYYQVLRVAQELERFGDLATNIAERVIYIVTGKLHEVNVSEPT